MLLAKFGAKICCCSQLASHASKGKIKKSELFSHIFAPFLTTHMHRYFQPLRDGLEPSLVLL
jgi:hypothetical protein